MIVFLIGISVFLLLSIFVVVFRIYSLMDIITDNYKKISNSSNNINAVLLFLFVIFGFVGLSAYSYLEFDKYQISVASEHGVITDQLFWITTVITGIVFFISQFLLFYYCYKYRYQNNKRGFFYVDDHKLELIWTVFPAIGLTILVFGG
jgi:cytochrome c oxidase subunit 2